MENNPAEYNEAIEKSIKCIQAIQAMGFDISYHHLANAEQEIKFTKKESGMHPGVERTLSKVIPSKQVLNPMTFAEHLEKILAYLQDKW